VNAWIGDMRAGRNGATLTTEYDFPFIVKSAIRDWEPADSAAVGLYVLDDLSNNSGTELALALQIPAYDPALAADLFSPRPVFDAFTAPLEEASPSGILPLPGSVGAHRALFHEAAGRMGLVGARQVTSHPTDQGSNNWAVAPGRTSGGHALLANDPHLSLMNPSIWFPIEIDAVSNGTGKYHVAGSTFPGLPSPMVGHNESIGWGVTTAYYDLADVYLEELTPDGAAVMFNGAAVPIIEKEVSFEDASTGTPVTKTLRWVPHHGPIVAEDLEAGTATTIRWRGHDGGTDLDAFFGLARAASVEEARTALEATSSASQNFVIVDRDGHIGWFPYCKVPERDFAFVDGLAPWLPLPGDGSAEWGPPIPLDAIPTLEDPPSGVIATANQDMTGASADGDLLNDGVIALQAFGMAEGTREQRILDLLEDGGDAHTVETMHAMQGDAYSLYGEIVTPAILAAAAGQPLGLVETQVIDALAAWQYTCPTGLDGADPVASPDAADPALAAESIGCTAFHASLFAIVEAALGDEMAEAEVDARGWAFQLVARALRDPASIASGDLLWDDVSTPDAVETRDEILLRGVGLAAEALARNGEPSAWRWGRVHTLTLRSIYDSFGVASYNDGPYAAPGGLLTVNVANPRSRTLPADDAPWDFAFASGPSVRFVVEALPEGPRMTYELPGGTDLHRESAFYNNLLPAWLANEPVEFPFGPGAVASPTVTIEVSPAR
jgi:penicillin amidase